MTFSISTDKNRSIPPRSLHLLDLSMQTYLSISTKRNTFTKRILRHLQPPCLGRCLNQRLELRKNQQEVPDLTLFTCLVTTKMMTMKGTKVEPSLLFARVVSSQHTWTFLSQIPKRNGENRNCTLSSSFFSHIRMHHLIPPLFFTSLCPFHS